MQALDKTQIHNHKDILDTLVDQTKTYEQHAVAMKAFTYLWSVFLKEREISKLIASHKKTNNDTAFRDQLEEFLELLLELEIEQDLWENDLEEDMSDMLYKMNLKTPELNWSELDEYLQKYPYLYDEYQRWPFRK